MSVERRPSTSSLGTPRRYSLVSEVPPGRPHTRVDDEGAVEMKYTFGEVLGKGSFGVVHEVTNRLTGERFAVKIVNKDKPGSTAIRLLEREVEVLKRVKHPHIIRLEEVFETPKKMFLIMELCARGELTKLLKNKGYLKEEEAKAVMKKLTEVVVYMHDNDMVHRDLKLENILLSTCDPDNGFDIKVTDFGLVHMRSLPGCDDDMISRCGTLYYMAPEVLNNKHEYTKMCDVWSMGVIMYTLLCGRVPFKSENAVKLEELITQGELSFIEHEWVNVSKKAKELLRAMLCVDTTQRFTARSVLDDPWFTGKDARVLNALDLMRDMHAESTGQSNPSATHNDLLHHSIEEEPTQQGRKSEQAKQTPTKTLVGKRTRSTPAVLPPVGTGGLKFPSTSTISSTSKVAPTCCHGHKQRSSSVSGSSRTSPVKRPTSSYPGSRGEKKSLPARTE